MMYDILKIVISKSYIKQKEKIVTEDFVNYYGMLRDKINFILNKHKNLIIDNTHDFFNNNNYEETEL